MNSVEVSHLVKQYGDYTAVDDISFTVKEGAFFGFLGPNGAGKTTTMRILSTLLKKTSGDVKVSGFDVEADPNGVRHSIGFAMQDISLDNMATGWENLQLLGVLYGLTPLESRKRAGELLDIVGLSKVADQFVTSYSGGMRRRLDLAGVLMHSPKVLFLDEPTQGLDPQARRTIWDYLQKLNADGTTVFLTTHYMDEADILCEKLAFIDKGKLVAQGTPHELKSKMGGDVMVLEFKEGSNLASIEKLVGSSLHTQVERKGEAIVATAENMDQRLPKLIAALDENKTAPKSVHITQASLEDVFVKLVGRSFQEEDASQLVKGRDPFIQGRQ